MKDTRAKVNRIRKRMVKKMLIIIGIILVLSVISIITLSIYYSKQIQNEKQKLINNTIDQDFYPVYEVMAETGYKEITEDSHHFRKDTQLPVLDIKFDYKEKKCTKNGYTFDLKDHLYSYHDKYYVTKKKLEAILNYTLEYTADNKISAKVVTYEQHEWTEAFTPLVAHAGGGVRETTFNSTYTNAIEAFLQNYNMGHRVFEVDLIPTSDDKLAGLHDWNRVEDGQLTAEEWKEYVIHYKSANKEGSYTSVLFGDILDQMMINKDMFIITDTKSFELTPEDCKMQFEIIYEEAKERDPELLERIIPQIYNEENYKIITEVYPFQSIIYTLYATDSTNEEILSFVEKHDDIEVVTMRAYTERVEAGIIDKLNEMGKLVYAHTYNKYIDIADLKKRGVYGIYTDFITPAVYNEYVEYAIDTRKNKD